MVNKRSTAAVATVRRPPRRGRSVRVVLVLLIVLAAAFGLPLLLERVRGAQNASGPPPSARLPLPPAPAPLPPLPVARRYRVSDLGPLLDDQFGSVGLNERGQIVGGNGGRRMGDNRAFVRSAAGLAGRSRDLAGLPGDGGRAATNLNDRGRQAIGYVMLPETGLVADLRYRFTTGRVYRPCAVVWDKPGGGAAAPRALALLPGAEHVTARAINDSGQIAGTGRVRGPAGPEKPLLWENGRVYTLSLPPGSRSGHAADINDRGQIVGGGHGGRAMEALFWERGRPRRLVPLPGAAWNDANAINERGDVVGTALFRGGGAAAASRALLWDAGPNHAPRELAPLPGDQNSRASDLNDRGQVVGTSLAAAAGPGNNWNPPRRAWVWAQGTMHDLNALLPPGSGWHLSEAVRVNNRGEIAGRGTRNNKPRLFLLTPESVRNGDSK